MDLASSLSPLDTAQLRRVAGAMGTNPAAIFEDEHGRRFYIKTLESKAHAQSELLAAALYRLAGAPTLTYVPVVAPDQVATILVALEKKRISSLSEDERRQAQHWLGVHAWTANWDAAGFEGDNQGVVQGVVLTLDVGGALEFRAQGYPKGKAFGTRVGELESLRTEQNNPYAVKLFGDISKSDLQRAILVVTQIPDDKIRQVVIDHGGRHTLANKLIARKVDMQQKLAELG
ncbi:MAG: hypothetical protein RL385_5123 [Pseudomonadota bacterium]|jgi:hypothetical protein